MIFERIIKLLAALLFATAVLLRPAILSAQPEENEKVDEIVAVVGNEIIMLSELRDQLRALAYQDRTIDPEDPEIRREILKSIIDEKLVVAKAIEDSVEVSAEEVNQQMNDLIKSLVMRYGSEKRVEDVYRMSISRLKYEYKEQVRKSLLSNKIRAQKFGNVKVTPKEVEEFYEEYKDTLQVVPAQMELYHIVKNIESDLTAKKDIYKKAIKVRDSILSGKGDFGEFARRYSAHSGTAAEGGDLGWVRKGKLFPEFEKAAYNLTPGEISQPVETPFGFHLIKTIEKKENSIHAKHILFKLGQTSKDKDKARDFLLDLKKRAEEGEDFKELAKKYSDDEETRGFGGKIGKLPVESLTPTMREALEDLPEGGITDPIPYKSDPDKDALHIIYKERFIPEHFPTLEQDYDKIEQKATMVKRLRLYDEWVKKLREEMYWEIKED